ncbi:unnamed protein product [Rotaria sordida]|uniref:EXPERA domain-containing protein n=1 Tax=Rotaria sordida TaxID=392033 RepID=A0A818WJ98_9BILA|nr:unnamed protein product [Rotaria sordida]CAF1407310.1 unnamed protein product [Rotaria sordida]CAF3726304.1 unnamed protein product [Rotaria sordida]CAF3881723.1 unnamed protein product [Rotaria sordida]
MYRSKKKKSKVSTHDTIETNSQIITTNDQNLNSKIEMQMIESESAIRILIGIIGVSLLSVPICYILSYMKQMKNSLNVFLYSVIICISVALLTYYLLIKHLLYIKKEMYFYIFTIFSFTAIADFLLALTIDNYSLAFHFYLNQGEVYLKTSHGLYINYWDGTIHYTLYLIMLYYMLKQQTETKFFRFLSLFWCGSIINSLIVLLGGAAIGQYGIHIKPSYLLNIPYTIFPIIFMIRKFNSRSNFIQQERKKIKKSINLKSLIFRPWDIFFIFYMLFAIIFAIFRALHALKVPMMSKSIYYEYEPYILNESGFPLIQLLTYAFYFVPYYCSAINALLFYNQQPSKFQWLPDWTMVHAGAAAQAQFSYLFSSLHNPPLFPDSSWSPIPSQYWFTSVSLNAILAIVPQLFAFRICTGNRDKDFY